MLDISKMHQVKYYRTYSWKGKVYRKECTDHKNGYSGSMPCTGLYRCIFCGKIADRNHWGEKQ